MSKLLFLTLLILLLYVVVRQREGFEDDMYEDVQEATRARNKRVRRGKVTPRYRKRGEYRRVEYENEANSVVEKPIKDYLLPSYTVDNTRVERLEQLRHDLRATGDVLDNDPNNLSRIFDALNAPEVEIEPLAKATLDAPIKLKAGYTPDWVHYNETNATVDINNYQRYEGDDLADYDGIIPYDHTENMSAAVF